jgi:hypothetical protein
MSCRWRDKPCQIDYHLVEHVLGYLFRVAMQSLEREVYCFIDDCGLAVGYFHFAQGDGEVAGTAIEIGGRMTVTPRLVENCWLTIKLLTKQ